MRLPRDGKITKILLALFFFLVLGYAYFEAQGFLFGPSISVTETPTEVHDPFFTVQGTAVRISSLSMNGAEISVTEDGGFSEPYLLADGLNRIVLDAKDKYGRSSRAVVQVVYIPPETPVPAPQTATSTPLSASTSPAVAQ